MDVQPAFLAAFAHQLRHTVGAVLHQVELVTGDAELGSATRQRSMAALIANVEELVRFTDCLTDLERLARHEFQPTAVNFDVVAFLEEAMRHRSSGLGEDDPSECSIGGIPTAIHTAMPSAPRTPAGGETLVHGDPALLRRALAAVFAEVDAEEHVLGVELLVTTPSFEAPRVELVIFSGERGDDDRSGRAVAIVDGLGPYVAAGLAELAGAALTIEPAPAGRRAFRVRFRPADPSQPRPRRDVGD